MLFASDLMTVEPDTVAPNATLREALVIMNVADDRQLPVLENGRLVGIITNRDIRLALDSPLLDKDSFMRMHILHEHTVAECMTPDPITVSSTTPIHEVAELLVLHKIGGLPVMEHNVLVGIITITDLLRQMAKPPQTT
jgi:acetoin utilization protein AcuB